MACSRWIHCQCFRLTFPSTVWLRFVQVHLRTFGLRLTHNPRISSHLNERQMDLGVRFPLHRYRTLRLLVKVLLWTWRRKLDFLIESQAFPSFLTQANRLVRQQKSCSRHLDQHYYRGHQRCQWSHHRIARHCRRSSFRTFLLMHDLLHLLLAIGLRGHIHLSFHGVGRIRHVKVTIQPEGR